MQVSEKFLNAAVRGAIKSSTMNAWKTIFLYYQSPSRMGDTSIMKNTRQTPAVVSGTPSPNFTHHHTVYITKPVRLSTASSFPHDSLSCPRRLTRLMNRQRLVGNATRGAGMWRGVASPASMVLMAGDRWSSIQRHCFGSKAKSTQIQPVDKPEGEEEESSGQEDGDPNRGYLPFRAPFHTFNIIMLLFLGNILCYLVMGFGNDSTRDFLVEHFTLSRENWTRVYPLVLNAFFQENLLQLLIDCWLLSSVGNTLLSFIGNTRLSWLCLLCVLGGSVFHLLKQQYFLYNGEDELVVRGRVYGPNTFIMGLIALEGLIFRHLTFVQQPPIPYLVLTAFVMALDVWRISTVMPEEHSAATGGALMALVFWALPIRFFGMDKLTAMV